MKTDLFQSCGHYWVFQICWHIKCSTLTASSFRIWNSSAGIPSPPLALLQDPTDFTVHGILQARILEWVAFPSPGELPNPGIEPRSPALQADSSPGEPQGKPKKTRVGSLSLLQGSSRPRNWTRVFLYYRGILYQLNSPWNLSYRQFGSGGIIVKCLSFNQSKWSTVIVKSSCTIYHTVIS